MEVIITSILSCYITFCADLPLLIVAFFGLFLQNENRALRLKEPAPLGLSTGTSGSYVDPDGTAVVMSSELLPAPTADPRVTWNYFDEQG